MAIDRLTFSFQVLDDKKVDDIKEKPEDGCYIYGMYMEGARWNSETHHMDDSLPKELYTDVPIMWLLPAADRKTPDEVQIYIYIYI